MQRKNFLKLAVMAGAFAFAATNLQAQDRGNDSGSRGYGGGGHNWDPAEIQQRILDGIQARLGFTKQEEWDVVKPLVQKVIDAGRDVLGSRQDLLSGGRSRLAALYAQPNVERDALQSALDANVPTAQLKDLMAKYKAAQKIKQARLEAAQNELKQVLSTRQEAQALLLGLVN